MTDDRDKRGRQTPTVSKKHRAKDSRRDRLKLALRENLKRRKSQARARSEIIAPSNDDGLAPHDEICKKPGG
jgi:hypothetical protein